jgi:hypothetical protein
LTVSVGPRKVTTNPHLLYRRRDNVRLNRAGLLAHGSSYSPRLPDPIGQWLLFRSLKKSICCVVFVARHCGVPTKYASFLARPLHRGLGHPSEKDGSWSFFSNLTNFGLFSNLVAGFVPFTVAGPLPTPRLAQGDARRRFLRETFCKRVVDPRFSQTLFKNF